MTQVVTRFDFRAPGATDTERAEMFERCVEQSAYADTHGHTAVMFSEHHGSPDGYLPAPLLVASAVAARTTRIPITVSALLVNLYAPRRLAEDIAVLDLLSAGRVSYVFALGYRPVEYAMLDRPWATRGADIEAAIAEMIALWAGATIDTDGESVRVTPPPMSRPHPFIYYGGGSPAAARRAARLGLAFAPQLADRTLRDLYRSECDRLGRPRGHVLMPPVGPASVFCSRDPDRFWARFGHHLLADARGYSAWHGALRSHVRDDATTVDELRSHGSYLVVSPEMLIEMALAGDLPLITNHPLCAGLPAEPSWESLHLITDRVLPALS